MNKEKQIEEMVKATAVCTDGCLNCESRDTCYTWELCEAFYHVGFRNYSENTVELPCKVGDTVYRVKKRRGVWCILPREVVSITYRLDHLGRVVWEIFSTETDVLGKNVFLTEDEADQAIAKMKGGAE